MFTLALNIRSITPPFPKKFEHQYMCTNAQISTRMLNPISLADLISL